jgi:hypothetical protein
MSQVNRRDGVLAPHTRHPWHLNRRTQQVQPLATAMGTTGQLSTLNARKPLITSLELNPGG